MTYPCIVFNGRNKVHVADQFCIVWREHKLMTTKEVGEIERMKHYKIILNTLENLLKYFY